MTIDKEAPVICWLRRDLRLHDHAALFHAVKTGAPLQFIFIFDEKILAPLRSEGADQRLSFIIEALGEIETALAQKGGSLKILHGDPVTVLPEYAAAIGAQALFYNEDYEPYATERDANVSAKLKAQGKAVNRYKDHVIFGAHEVLKDDGEIYKVFTPYKRRWLERFLAQGREVADYDIKLAQLRPFKNSECIKSKDWHRELGFKALTPALPGTRAAALERLEYFKAHILKTYDESRDFVDRDGTSLISPYIRHGLVSIRELVRLALEQKSVGAQMWLSELIWREFYQMLLAQIPTLPKVAFKPSYDSIKWHGGEKEFKAWQTGQTGYPLVDAAMRCLNETGLMPNRLRMVSASFLCKTLLVDWRLGEAHFARKLLDFDLAANNGGWQWSASCGADAQPYFRIFNPYAQSEKFDPEGEFIKRWCPELALLPAKFIHDPTKLTPLEEQLYGVKIGQTYPAPVVIYKDKREEALKMYKAAGL